MVVGLLYDVAVWGDWTLALRAAVALFGADAGEFAVHDTRRLQSLTNRTLGGDCRVACGRPDAVTGPDILALAKRAASPGTHVVVTLEADPLGPAQPRDAAMRPHRAFHALIGLGPHGGPGWGVMILTRSQGCAVFNSDGIAAMGVLLPHLLGVLRLRRRLDELARDRARALRALEQIGPEVPRPIEGAALAAGVELSRRYGLTAAEARVGWEVLDAPRLADIAARQGVTLATVRTLLQRVYAKTGTHRQADLVRLLLAPATPSGAPRPNGYERG
jgi:DNA-binding CsgD family transcriptional regulator